MARDGVPVDPEFAALVMRFVQGERFNVRAECLRVGQSKTSFYKYVTRFRVEGVDGLYPRSRRPGRSPGRVGTGIEELIVRIRKELGDDGWDNGASSIEFGLQDAAGAQGWPAGQPVPSRATINRVLARRGQLVAVPQRRPRAASRRFEADQPNTRWQMDGFEVTLADGTVVVVLHIIDDCSRLDIALRAVRSENALDVWETVTAATAHYGLPREVLTDNGTAFSGRRRGWLSTLEKNLATLGVRHITSSIRHPQTCGKCERGHQTVLKWLARRAFASIAELNTGLETYRTTNNEHRRRVHLHGMTPGQRYRLGPPDGPDGPAEHAVIVHSTTVGHDGKITIDRTAIGLGRRYTGTPVTYFRRDRRVSIFTATALIAEFDLKTPRGGYQRVTPPANLSTKS